MKPVKKLKSEVSAHDAVAPPTRLWAEVKLTCNLGDFESMTFTVGEERPLEGNDKAATTVAIRNSLMEHLIEQVSQHMTDVDITKYREKAPGHLALYVKSLI